MEQSHLPKRQALVWDGWYRVEWRFQFNSSGDALMNMVVSGLVFSLRESDRCLAGNFRLNCLFILIFCLLAPGVARSQATETQVKRPVESELIVEGEGSFGHFRIYASTWWSEIYTGGVEYDRHSWGSFLKARMDYVAEVLPVAILRQPAVTDVWGDPLTQSKELVPGVALSPIGLRMMWRSNKSIKPYFLSKGGIIAFDKKALSEDATYGNFLLQIGTGMQARLTQRLDLRVGLGYMHFSNGFIVPSNPGLDSMTYHSGLSYHFGK